MPSTRRKNDPLKQQVAHLKAELAHEQARGRQAADVARTAAKQTQDALAEVDRLKFALAKAEDRASELNGKMAAIACTRDAFSNELKDAHRAIMALAVEKAEMKSRIEARINSDIATYRRERADPRWRDRVAECDAHPCDPTARIKATPATGDAA